MPWIAILFAVVCDPRLVLIDHEYGADDFARWPKSGWVAWSAGRNAQSVTFKIAERVRGCGDDEDVRIDGSGMAFAVRCVRGVRAGRVISVNPPELLLPNQPVSITLGGARYELLLKSNREDFGDARVVLSSGKRTQVLYAIDGFADDAHFSVVWAGDLDRDGKLDLLTNFSHKYSLHPFKLFLSSHATKGRLVGEAASLLKSAC
jgi:hypothetical protein